MALLLTEDDVRSLLTMPMAVEAMREAFTRLGANTGLNFSRQRLHLQGFSYLHYMAAADGAGGYMGMKIYTSSREGLRFLVPLFDAKTGDLLALIEADYLGQMRTGAASGFATQLLARADASRVGIIGTGVQARTQLEAIAAVRKIKAIRAFGRDPGRRNQFAREMTAKLSITVEPADSAESAVRDADIVVTATSSTPPVAEGRWLRPGMHVNAIGANFPQKREWDAEAIRRADLIFVDSCEQAKMEAGDLLQVFGNDPAAWANLRELSDLTAGRAQGRTSAEQITLFKSSGIAMEDVVTAGKVYENALKEGIGKRVGFWEKGSEERQPRI